MGAKRERKNQPISELRESILFDRAKGRCECDGLCGHNHRWLPDLPPERCNVTHGVNVVRKLGHPSYARHAPLEGFAAKQEGPRTHPPGRYVTEGLRVDFAFPEQFDMKRISQIWLTRVRVASSGDDEYKLLCQFCAQHGVQSEGA